MGISLRLWADTAAWSEETNKRDRMEDAGLIVYGRTGPASALALFTFPTTHDSVLGDDIVHGHLVNVELKQNRALIHPAIQLRDRSGIIQRAPLETWSHAPLRLWEGLAETDEVTDEPTVVGFLPPDSLSTKATSLDLETTALRNAREFFRRRATMGDITAEFFGAKKLYGPAVFNSPVIFEADDIDPRLLPSITNDLFLYADNRTTMAALTDAYESGFWLRRDYIRGPRWTLVREGVRTLAIISKSPASDILMGQILPRDPDSFTPWTTVASQNLVVTDPDLYAIVNHRTIVGDIAHRSAERQDEIELRIFEENFEEDEDDED